MGVCRALGVEAFFQGWGSPVCARLLTAWYSVPSAAVGGHYGTRRITSAAPHSHCDGSERAALRLACRDDIAGCMAIVVGIFLCWRLRDRRRR